MWIAALAIQAFAAILFWRRSLVSAVPVLWCSFLFSIMKGVALLTAANYTAYSQISRLTAPITLLLAGIAVAEIFKLTTAQYPNFSRFGNLILTAVALLSATISGATRYLRTADSWLWGSEVLLERYATCALVFATVATWLAIRTIGFPIPRATTRIVWFLFFDAACGLVHSVVMSGGHAPFSIRVAFPIAYGLVSSALWCFVPRWVGTEMPALPSEAEINAAKEIGPAILQALRNTVVAVQRVTQ